jgi:hypothetical protein
MCQEWVVWHFNHLYEAEIVGIFIYVFVRLYLENGYTDRFEVLMAVSMGCSAV